jgi:ABC-2 type transport system ATP-binding protein
MSKSDQTVIHPSVTEADGNLAVKVKGIFKTFEQTRNKDKSVNFVKRLFSTNKKTVTALDDITFSVEKGGFVAYAGPNGAGKSTTIKILCGMLVPNSGSVEISGLTPRKHRINLMKKTGVLFGNRTELWWDHPVISSFEWKKAIWNIPDGIYEKTKSELTELLDIKDILQTFARELSLGQRMRADIAMMLLHNPDLLLLDEPTLGLDVLAKRDIIIFLKKINSEKKTTIIVTSHDMDDLEEMASRILLISNGKLAFDGSFDRLRHDTGSYNRVVLTMHDGNRPELNAGKLIEQKGGVYEYEINTNEVSINKLLHELSLVKNISDIEVKKAPIEQVIANLYKSWKK